ncbi:MAG: hypothetical protein FJ284_04120 [Planctomycetes bacterium]|nr:hypothetical protein [Planctomycetota bacterium]
MTLDAFDRAFVARWHAQRSTTTAPAAEPLAIVTPDPDHAEAAASPGGEPPDEDGSLVARLLAVGSPQWHLLADEVEAARLAGHRVIAVAGGERGEGRTTLVACLSHMLRGRQRDVVVLDSVSPRASDDGIPVDGGRLHDKRIILVDAGVWFPSGPIRRNRLLIASLGCDAVILVRRADRMAVPARATALAALGVTPLGEVITFADPARSAAGAVP